MRRIISAGVVVAVAALTAPGAGASHTTAGCRLRSVSAAKATGPRTYDGIVEGAIVGNTGETLTIRCVVKVNGTVRTVSPWTHGTTVATTSSPVTFTAAVTDATQVCAQYTHSHGYGETCFGTTVADMIDVDQLTELPPLPEPPPGLRASCARYRWVDGDSCEFDAPGGAFAFSGSAENPGGEATVVVHVLVNGIGIGTCQASGPDVATCRDVLVSPYPHLPHTCLVFGTGGSHFQCADPPRLPIAP